mmetsp:Transcript_55905/g.130902  ORF Transcript_55905/g.130902 Transcript_55905/m.130902 type:complete len:93 (-) Transcript_55905:101-379(-)
MWSRVLRKKQEVSFLNSTFQSPPELHQIAAQLPMLSEVQPHVASLLSGCSGLYFSVAAAEAEGWPPSDLPLARLSVMVPVTPPLLQRGALGS